MSKSKRGNRRGQSLVEYGLILALVSVVAIAVLNAMGGQIKDTVTNITDKLEAANTTSDTNSNSTTSNGTGDGAGTDGTGTGSGS